MSILIHELLPLAAMARRLDVSPARLVRLIKSGKIKPDAVAGRSLLFEPRRVEALAAQIPGARILIVQ